MPTLNAYQNDPGHHIVGKLPDGRFATYQVDSEASTILQNLGYSDEDTLPWSVLNALRAVGIVTIGGDGSRRDDDEDRDEPDSKGTPGEIPENLVAQLIDEIEALSGVSDQEVKRAKAILGAESTDERATSKTTLQQQADSFETAFNTQLNYTDLQKSDVRSSILFVSDGRDSGSVSVSLKNGEQSDYVVEATKLLEGPLIDSIRGDNMGMLLFSVPINSEPGTVTKFIDEVTVTIDPWSESDIQRQNSESQVSLKDEGIAYRAVDDLLPIVKSAIEDEGIVSNLMITNVEVTVERM